jgi:hypothetical protein
MSLPANENQHGFHPSQYYHQAQAQPWHEQQMYAQQQHADMATATYMLNQPLVHISSFDEDAMDELDDSLTDMDWIRHTAAPEHHAVLTTPERRSMVAVPAEVADFDELDIMLSVAPEVSYHDCFDTLATLHL